MSENLFFSALVGAVQGLTEFLPVSSSAHLVIVKSLLPGFSEIGVSFDILLHLGTLLAVLIYFRRDIISFKLKDIFLLGIATIPAVVVGLLLKDVFELLFQSVRYVAFELILTGFLCILIDKLRVRSGKVGVWEAVVMGIGQAIAISPGISRSGATIFAGLLTGVDRKQVAKFSFLMSIPAILGANLLSFLDLPDRSLLLSPNYVAGFVSAFIVGYFSIGILMKLLISKKFKYFGYYCFILAAVVLFVTR